jgi:hypothetical protein
MRPYTYLLITAFAFGMTGCSRGGEDSLAGLVEVLEVHDVSGLNKPLEENVLTADIVIFYSDKTEVTWEEMREEFTRADSIFRAAGVQLNLKKALKVDYPETWAGMASGEGTNVPTDDTVLDFYKMMDYEQEVLPDSLESILDAFLADEENRERTIFVIPLNDLTVSWYERDENNKWRKVTSPTSAISFPSYVFADRIPKHLRGVISFQRSKPGRRVLAHELGHKLINVSHEGLEVCPQGSGTGVPGLMGYADETEIYGGEEGRWHKERLLLSPFLYRMVDGEKIWNPEYERGGSYDDPIYKGYFMEPACPTSSR